MTRPLRVKFILPALIEATSPYWRPIKYSLFPPLGLATLAAYLRPDDEAVLVDEHVAALGTDDAPDLVVIQVYITNARRAYALADAYRKKGVFVALGGLHVTSLPDEAALHADAVFLGPGEQTFPQFLADFRAGRAASRYRSTVGRTLDRLPPVRRDLIDRRIVADVIEGRGWIIDTQDEVGGYPQYTATSRPFVEADWNLDTMEPHAGYTRGEPLR